MPSSCGHCRGSMLKQQDFSGHIYTTCLACGRSPDFYLAKTPSSSRRLINLAKRDIKEHDQFQGELRSEQWQILRLIERNDTMSSADIYYTTDLSHGRVRAVLSALSLYGFTLVVSGGGLGPDRRAIPKVFGLSDTGRAYLAKKMAAA